ncbi:MAG: undecaprenyl-phosphate alpha-N-acetylglucosaminyl 1-phosphate transferase [Chitinophagales bacterium]|nr:MAG: undecaprenyl-phosphate alpha-N-acetylglucosaminyl 1-phosphate transferase [Chitinophagales bacterium]
MSSDPMLAALFYATFFAIAVCFSVLINFLILRFSRNLGMRNIRNNQFGGMRWGSTSKPSVGGFSFYIIFLISISVLGVIPVEDQGYFNKQLIGLLVACSMGFLLGLADDAYNTNPLVKFIGQFTCANLLVATNFQIAVTPLPEINYIITVLWVIGLMNSINMLDNMDAITASVSVCIILGAIALIILNGDIDNVYLIIMLGVLGALTGFLFFNWHPSKIYMGDTGSQFLGVFLAAISILFFWNYRESYTGFIELRQFLIPMLLFIIPLIDTTTVVIRRLARRQSPFVGGKDHITHQLAYLGLSDRWVAIVLSLVSLVSVFLVVFIYTNLGNWHARMTFLTLGYFALVFIVFQILYDMGRRKHEQRPKS